MLYITVLFAFTWPPSTQNDPLDQITSPFHTKPSQGFCVIWFPLFLCTYFCNSGPPAVLGPASCPPCPLNLSTTLYFNMLLFCLACFAPRYPHNLLPFQLLLTRYDTKHMPSDVYSKYLPPVLLAHYLDPDDTN